MIRDSFTLNEFPVTDRNSGHAINIVDIMKDAVARRFSVVAERAPQIHAVDGQIRRIATGGCYECRQPVGNV